MSGQVKAVSQATEMKAQMAVNAIIYPTQHTAAKMRADAKIQAQEAEGKTTLGFHERYEIYALEFKKESLSQPESDNATSSHFVDLPEIEISVSRKRTVTYWGNNCQYDKEEILVTSSLTRTINKDASLDEIDKMVDLTLTHMQTMLKRVLDKQEQLLPAQGGDK